MRKVTSLAVVVLLASVAKASMFDQVSNMILPSQLTNDKSEGIANGIINSIDAFYTQFFDVYGMLTRSDEYLQKVRQNHERYGAFRSGEGTP